MFIERIEIGRYKKLKNFSLQFTSSSNLFEGENFKLSVLIGENGTAKTTILQSIVNILSNSKEKNKMEDYYITFKDDIIPSKLIISSFTPMEKDYLQAKQSENSLCSVIYSEMGISKLKYIIVKYILENTRNIKKMNSIVEYIGYNPIHYFLEFNKSVKSILTANDSFIRNLYKGTYDNVVESMLKSIDIERDIENIVYKYEENLDSKFFGSYRSRRTLRDYLERFNGSHYSTARSRFSFEELQRIYLEYIYIILKMHMFSIEVSQRINTNYKGEEQRVVSNRDLHYYFNGLSEFESDLMFLEKFSRFVINDIWFESNNTPDLVPLSYWSSGELSLFLRLVEISESISENSIILIDEPETHLHPKWIKNYMTILNSIIGKFKCHVIIATHAPLIVSDIPRESIIMLKKEEHLIKQWRIQEETIGLEYEEVLRKVFEVNNSKGTILESFEQRILKSIEDDDLNTVIKLYDQLGDSPTKFDLFLKIKKYYNDRKRNE
jgi:predicted ATP-dependent endonuclease of OLD family